MIISLNKYILFIIFIFSMIAFADYQEYYQKFKENPSNKKNMFQLASHTFSGVEAVEYYSILADSKITNKITEAAEFRLIEYSFSRGKYPDVFEKSKLFLEKYPKSTIIAKVIYLKSISLLKMNRLNEAFESSKEYIGDNPKYIIQIGSARAYILSLLHKEKESIKVIDSLLLYGDNHYRSTLYLLMHDNNKSLGLDREALSWAKKLLLEFRNSMETQVVQNVYGRKLLGPSKPVLRRSGEFNKELFTIQTGAYSLKDNAQLEANRLNRIHYGAEIVKMTSLKGDIYLVWIGSFDSKIKAKEFAEGVLKLKTKQYWVKIRL